MIPLEIARTAATALRRDRGALALGFILPLAFFTIFALVFGGRATVTPRIKVIVADADHSRASQALVRALSAESLTVETSAPGHPERPVEHTAATAEAAVKAGAAPVAIVIPRGFGEDAVAAGRGAARPRLELLRDPSDPIASQVVAGLLQKVVMSALPELMAERGARIMDVLAGGFTPAQRARVEGSIEALRARRPAEGGGEAGPGAEALVTVAARDVVGPGKRSPMISFYAAAIGVMFLLFTASATGGSLLDEAESGTLDRVLASRVTMGTLLAGKLLYATALAFAQLVLMFVWAWLVFGLDLLPHLLGFTIMGLSTSFAVGAFGMLLAVSCRTRAQLGALSTLVILVMSSIGGSMFPRVLMSEAMQRAGLLTLNAWAIDGFTKVFWRDEPVAHLWPQVLVLLGAGSALLAIARRLARRWEEA